MAHREWGNFRLLRGQQPQLGRYVLIHALQRAVILALKKVRIAQQPRLRRAAWVDHVGSRQARQGSKMQGPTCPWSSRVDDALFQRALQQAERKLDQQVLVKRRRALAAVVAALACRREGGGCA